MIRVIHAPGIKNNASLALPADPLTLSSIVFKDFASHSLSLKRKGS